MVTLYYHYGYTVSSLWLHCFISWLQGDSALGMEAALHARDKTGVQDFVLLEDYKSTDAFLENLRKRFKENLIYVSTISVNKHISRMDLGL